jgi:hypothetical protein
MQTGLQRANLAHMHSIRGATRHGHGWAWTVLSSDEAALAFPLIVAVDGPGLGLADWRCRVRAWIQRGGGRRDARGIVGLRTGLATIFSVFFFCVHDRGRLGRSLCVPRAWLLDIGGHGRAPRATFEAVEQVARHYDCQTVAIELALAEGPARHIARALHRVDQGRGVAWGEWPAAAIAASRRPGQPSRAGRHEA